MMVQTISSVPPILASHPLTTRKKATSLHHLYLKAKKAWAPSRLPDISVLPTKVLSHFLLNTILKLNSRTLNNQHMPHSLCHRKAQVPTGKAPAGAEHWWRMAPIPFMLELFSSLAECSDLTMTDSKVGKRLRGAQALSEVTKLA